LQSLTPAEAMALAASTPAVAWVAGSVHGNEPSGCDASIQMLYELASRSDAQAQEILNNVVLFVLPSQNPDGRAANTRRNANGFGE